MFRISSCGYFCADKRAEKGRPDSAYEIMESRMSEVNSLVLNDTELQETDLILILLNTGDIVNHKTPFLSILKD